MLYVCPLSRLEETIALSRAERVVSLLAGGTVFTRPAAIHERNHLLLSMNDIVEVQQDMVPPGREHVESLLAFAQSWDRREAAVIHCYAGISRSTAAAYIVAAALAPGRDEVEIAQTLRTVSPSATPNPRLIALADDLLGRRGRMVEAIASIGRGADAFEGVPFAMPLEAPTPRR
jgi:predicted protein tyrosine phosphatase